jgi:hypothetical protein
MRDREASLSRGGVAWIALLCGYSLVRAVLAWPILVHYGIDPVAFLVLDVGTAWPLGLAQVRIVQAFGARDWAAVQVWAAVAGVSFVIPYAYLLAAGHESIPAYVKAGLVAIVALIGAASVLRVRRACLVTTPPPGYVSSPPSSSSAPAPG